MGGISRKPPDLSVAVGKVLKASREARSNRQSLAAWPVGLLQQGQVTAQKLTDTRPASLDMDKHPQETQAQQAAPDRAPSASIMRLKQHKAGLRTAQPRAPPADSRDVSASGAAQRSSSEQVANHGQENCCMNMGFQADGAAANEGDQTPVRGSEMTTNPLWESFEGFKLQKSSRTTPQMTKRRAEPPSAATPPQAALPYSPATPDFHSPSLFTPELHSADARGAERPLMVEDTPELLKPSAEADEPAVRHSEMLHTSNLKFEKAHKQPRSHKKGSIFARFLQASGQSSPHGTAASNSMVCAFAPTRAPVPCL